MLLKRIGGKLAAVLSAANLLRKQKQHLEQENARLKETVRMKDEHIATLTQKLNKVEVARMLEAASGSRRSAVLRINGLIRDIDKCIALMNRAGEDAGQSGQ